ncbi:MAG: TIGR03936 family radical SAM-associated protein [Clostridia bacterium]|nr:TIGR03936 family radical SAM-associated protein [Clostridia bacterium]
MSRYVIIFSKTGYAKYTSHLDINRLFRRSIRKQGIKLAYSQGFNPHPKMSFGQPLSLGYTGLREILEIETLENYQPWYLKDKLREVMPEGIDIIDVKYLEDDVKSLAAICDYAVYEVVFPENITNVENYLAQDKIIALKKSKKSKELKEVDIKDKIRELVYNNNIMTITLDQGSISNLSPELLISTFLTFSDMKVSRSDIEVTRTKIGFKDFEI